MNFMIKNNSFKDKDNEKLIMNQITCISCLYKGFNTCPKEYFSILKSSLQIICQIALKIPSIKKSLIQLLKRLIPGLRDELLNESKFTLQFLFNNLKDMEDLIEIHEIMSELLSKCKVKTLELTNEIFKPILTKNFEYFSIKIENSNNEMFRIQNSLKKSYYLFLSSILENDCQNVILNSSEFKIIFESILKGSTNFDDLPLIQSSLNTMKALIPFIYQSGDHINSILMIIFQILKNVQFFDKNSKEMMALPNNLLHEICKLFKMIIDKNKNEFNKIQIPNKDQLLMCKSEREIYEILIKIL